MPLTLEQLETSPAFIDEQVDMCARWCARSGVNGGRHTPLPERVVTSMGEHPVTKATRKWIWANRPEFIRRVRMYAF